MRLSVSIKIFIINTLCGLVLSVIISLSIYNFFKSIFFSEYFKSKISLAKSVAKAIDGNLHSSFTNLLSLDNIEYRKYINYLNKVLNDEPDIYTIKTYLYDSNVSNFRYILHGTISENHILWIDSPSASFTVDITEDGTTITEIDNELWTNNIKKRSKSFNTDIEVKKNNNGFILYINNKIVAEFNSKLLNIKTMFGTLDKYTRRLEGTIEYDNKINEVSLGLTYAGESYAVPGELLIDTDDVIKLFKEVYFSGKDYAELETKKSIYGDRTHVFTMIRNNNDEIKGMLVLVVTKDKLNILINKINLISIAIFIIIFMFSIILMLLYNQIFTGKLIKIKNIISNIKNNNRYEIEIIRSRDEFEDLCISFNSLLKQINSLLDKIHNSSSFIKNSSISLNESVKKSENIISGQAAATKEIYSSILDFSKVLKLLETKMSNILELSKQSEFNISNGFNIINNNKIKMDEIKNSSIKVSESIKNLSKQIESIWDIVNIINTIADQTKIIAFNAELEASSAGESGKNFEIVATEIRRLADNTVASTKEIKTKINDIQKASDEIIIIIENEKNKIDEGAELSLEIVKIFQNILESSSQSISNLNEIFKTINIQNETIEQIIVAIKDITEKIDDFSTLIKSNTLESYSLIEMAFDLDRVLKKSNQ